MTLDGGQSHNPTPPTNLYSLPETTRRIPRAVLPLPVDTADALRQAGMNVGKRVMPAPHCRATPR